MKVLRADASVTDATASVSFGSVSDIWVTVDLSMAAAQLTEWTTSGGVVKLIDIGGGTDSLYLSGPDGAFGFFWNGAGGSETGNSPPPVAGAWQTLESHYVNGGLSELFVDGFSVWSTPAFFTGDPAGLDVGPQGSTPATGPVYYANVKVGTTRGATDIFSDDFSSGDLSAWSSTSGDVSVVDDPFPPPPSGAGQRVGIAFDDGPLEPNPTWTFLDDFVTEGSPFPPSFVAGYDTRNGRQTLISQTETGTATVYVNDRQGLFDNRNDDSPFQGKLSGKQILLQLWNPVTEVWEPQFRGHVDDYDYDIDGSAVDAHGGPINASIQIHCVDIFDYLSGYGLTPGLDGTLPTPAGMEDGVWYAPTSEGIQPRFFQILADTDLDPAMYHAAQGNVNSIGVKYDPDESALTALRDAADAELPFIANIYVDRYGRFIFRGRYSRFYPDLVAAEPGSDWDFQRWPLGDGKAIQSDPSRGQMRVLAYVRSRQETINAALAFPQGIKAEDMPGQVYIAPIAIAANGKHQAPPMSDLLTTDPESGNTDLVETALYAQLLVENKKDPRLAVSRLQLKAMRPDDPRAEATWGAICGADISHIVNLDVGYPGGTGLTGQSPEDDHYIEGRALTVRPLNPTHDYVECDLNVSPAIWSMDTHNVFPNPFE